MQFVRAAASDWPVVRDLLSEAGLPLDGAAEAFATGIVATEDARVVGCAAIEPYDRAAMLRSVAVAQGQRASGVGSRLVHAAEDLAREGGAIDLILLTETAESWFRGLGYSTIERATVPADVASSIEFETACSATAVAMRRSLAPAPES